MVSCFYLLQDVPISIVSWVGNMCLSGVVWLFARSRVACGFVVVHSFDWVFARFFLCPFVSVCHCSFRGVLCVCDEHSICLYVSVS